MAANNELYHYNVLHLVLHVHFKFHMWTFIMSRYKTWCCRDLCTSCHCGIFLWAIIVVWYGWKVHTNTLIAFGCFLYCVCTLENNSHTIITKQFFLTGNYSCCTSLRSSSWHYNVTALESFLTIVLALYCVFKIDAQSVTYIAGFFV